VFWTVNIASENVGHCSTNIIRSNSLNLDKDSRLQIVLWILQLRALWVTPREDMGFAINLRFVEHVLINNGDKVLGVCPRLSEEQQ